MKLYKITLINSETQECIEYTTIDESIHMALHSCQLDAKYYEWGEGFEVTKIEVEKTY